MLSKRCPVALLVLSLSKGLCLGIGLGVVSAAWWARQHTRAR